MMKLGVLLVIRTLLGYGIAAIVMMLSLPLLLLLMFILPQKARCSNSILFWVLHFFYRGVVWALLSPLRVEGSEYIPSDPSVIVANHQSAIDIPLLGMIMKRRPHVWYALSYYASMPILGFFVRRLGIPLNRSSSREAAHGLLRGIRLAADYPCHLVIFPEGTRNSDGEIHEFLRGFALIARKTKRAVVPVFMPYNRFVYPPQSFWIYGHPLLIIVGKAMELRESESDEEFTLRVHEWFKSQSMRL